MADTYRPYFGASEAVNGTAAADGRLDPLQKPSALTNEGLDIPGMRVILAPIPGLTKKDIMVDGSGKPRSFRFQMPPTESFSRALAHAHSDYDTLRLGQHSRPNGKMLESVRFSTLVVDWDAPWAVYPNTQKFDRTFGSGYSTYRDEMWNILNITGQLEEILDSGTPVRLYAGQPVLWEGGGGESGWDVNMPVTLRSLNIEERAGELDARYLDLEFVEYRSLKLNRRRLGKQKTKPARGTTLRPTTVEIYPDSRAFDLSTESQIATSGKATMSMLAKRYFGDPSQWSQITAANFILRKTSWSPNTPLGGLAASYSQGRPFKLFIPMGKGVDDEFLDTYMNPNSDAFLSEIPEEML